MAREQLGLAPAAPVDAVTKEWVEGYVDARTAISVKSYGALGDGIADDTGAIAEAIADAPPGSTITFPNDGNSVYRITSQLTWAKELHLDLCGSTLKAVGALDKWILVTAGGDGTHIANGVLDSGDAARTTVNFIGCDNVGVTGCRFVNKPAVALGDVAVKFNTSTHIWVKDCSFYDWGYRGADTTTLGTNASSAVSFADVGCTDGVISGCDFDHIYRPIVVVGYRHVISGNNIRNRFDNGIYLTSSNTDTQLFADIIIDGNYIEGSDEGVAMTGALETSTAWCERVVISNNIIRGFTLCGIDWNHRMRDVVITGNLLISDGGTITVSDGSTIGPAQGFMGIRPGAASATSLTTNFLINANVMIGAVNYAGLWLENLTNSVISDNYVYATFLQANLAFLKIDTVCDGVTISGNNLIVASGTTPTGMWIKCASVTGSRSSANNFVGVAAEYRYDAGSAGIPANWEAEGNTTTATLRNKLLVQPKVDRIKDTNGLDALVIAATASAVNYLQLTPGAAGSTVTLQALGTDTDIGLRFRPKGAGPVYIYADTGVTPTIQVLGADAAHNLNLKSKGTGTVQANGVDVATKIASTATLDFGSVTAQSYADLTIAVTGAAVGDCVALGVPTAAVTAGIAYTAWVSATNTVTVRAHNYTGGPLDPASGTFKAMVVK